MPVRVVGGIYHLMLFELELEETWGMGRLVLMNYLHRLGGDVGGKQSIRLGGRRILPEMLVFAVFAKRSLTLSDQSQYSFSNVNKILTLVT
jgi:hypothetical protein